LAATNQKPRKIIKYQESKKVHLGLKLRQKHPE